MTAASAFACTLDDVARKNPRVVALCNDSVGSAKLSEFREQFPRRLVNVGIAEQNMVGVAAGLAIGGKIPFVSGAACFLTGRAMEQIKNDVAYTNTNVKLCGVSTGLAYGPLGGTHHSIEDIAWMRAIANLTVIVPADPLETEQAVRAAADRVGPVYLRLSRMGVPVVHDVDYRFEIGRAARLRDGGDVTLIACGTLVTRALAAAELLAARYPGTRAEHGDGQAHRPRGDRRGCRGDGRHRHGRRAHRPTAGWAVQWPRSSWRPIRCRCVFSAYPASLHRLAHRSSSLSTLGSRRGDLRRCAGIGAPRRIGWARSILAIDQGTTNTKALVVGRFR